MPLTQGDVEACNGCERWYRHWMAPTRVQFSDGLRMVAERGEAGWLLDAVVSHEKCNRKLRAAIAADEDLCDQRFWTLTVNQKKNTAVLTCSKDSTADAVVTQRIKYTDFPLPKLTIYARLASADGLVRLCLPAEN